MAHRMARLPMTLGEAEGHFCYSNLCNTHNSGNITCLTVNGKARSACDLNFIVKGEGLLKVTRSHVHWKSDNKLISEAVLHRDVVTTGH